MVDASGEGSGGGVGAWVESVILAQSSRGGGSEGVRGGQRTGQGQPR